jgi:hypothetical protein
MSELPPIWDDAYLTRWRAELAAKGGDLTEFDARMTEYRSNRDSYLGLLSTKDLARPKLSFIGSGLAGVGCVAFYVGSQMPRLPPLESGMGARNWVLLAAIVITMAGAKCIINAMRKSWLRTAFKILWWCAACAPFVFIIAMMSDRRGGSYRYW